ncbi:MAG: cyclophilin-like fold protein [Lachnospiraceae bacterium]|nr:cyclophilin-like fold protein [Lachnospiraceae bacterium]
MKKKYIVLIVILILIIAIAGIFTYERLHASLYVDEKGTSFSVIGGADGPTAVFIAGNLPGERKNTAESNKEDEMKLVIGDTEVSVSWEQNAAVADLKEAVNEGPIVIEMSMYGGFEQVGTIGRNLTRNDKQTTTAPGDLVLYNGNQLVVFYGSNSWSYTRLGKIQDLSETELEELLSNGDVTITIAR